MINKVIYIANLIDHIKLQELVRTAQTLINTNHIFDLHL